MPAGGSINLVAPEAEERLLAACLESTASLMVAVGSGLRPEDFGSPGHELIYRTMREMMDRGQSVDVTTLVGMLEVSGKLDLIGGKGVIDRLGSFNNVGHHANDYAGIVRDRSIRRRLFDATEEIVNKIHSESDIRDLISGSENLIYRVADRMSGGAKDGMNASDLVELYRTRTTGTERVPYPYDTLNKETRGRERGSLTVWGGYTSDGKSIVGMQSALAAATAGKSVGYFSLEMTEEELLYRLLSMVSGIESEKVQTGALDLVESGKIDAAVHAISQLPLKTFHDSDYTPTEIRTIQMRERFDLVIVDYLQRFKWAEYAEIPRMAKQFKNLALSTKSCVDLLSQLTPAQVKPGGNQFPPPTNNNLFGGKATGHEANNVIFIYAEREQTLDDRWIRTGNGKIMSTKQRGGKGEFDFDVVFNPNRIIWEEPVESNLLHLHKANTSN